MDQNKKMIFKRFCDNIGQERSFECFQSEPNTVNIYGKQFGYRKANFEYVMFISFDKMTGRIKIEKRKVFFSSNNFYSSKLYAQENRQYLDRNFYIKK